jgi:hypothetical protein
MSLVKKVVKFVEEKENTKYKKMHRSKERITKYDAKDDTKVIEDPPQEKVVYMKVSPKNHFRPVSPPIQRVNVEELMEIMEQSVHYKEEEGEGWESDCDGWFD